MHIAGILIFVIQLMFAVHVVRTGRDTFWIYIIIFVPLLGCAIYFFSQVLPSLQHSRGAQKVKAGFIRSIDPQRELRNCKEQVEISDTLENRLALAQACLNSGHASEAIEIYTSILRIEENDSGIMQQLAFAYFEEQQYQLAKETLDKLIATNPDYKSSDGHLLYARCLQELGEHQAALQEYQVLAESYPGEEARYRYGLLLQECGQRHEAAKVFDTILLRTRRSPKYYRKKEKHWIQLARQQLT